MTFLAQLLLIVLSSATALCAELAWDNVSWQQSDRYQVQVYSTTNVTYTQDKIHSALSDWLAVNAMPNIPSNVMVNLYNIVPVTPDMLPPVETWLLYATVPCSTNRLKIDTSDRCRLFAVRTLDTATGRQSGFSIR